MSALNLAAHGTGPDCELSILLLLANKRSSLPKHLEPCCITRVLSSAILSQRQRGHALKRPASISGGTTMKSKRHSAAEISAKLEQAQALAAAGKLQSEIAKALGVSIMTLHRWRKLDPPEVAGPSAAVEVGMATPRARRRRSWPRCRSKTASSDRSSWICCSRRSSSKRRPGCGWPDQPFCPARGPQGHRVRARCKRATTARMPPAAGSRAPRPPGRSRDGGSCHPQQSRARIQ